MQNRAELGPLPTTKFRLAGPLRSAKYAVGVASCKV